MDPAQSPDPVADLQNLMSTDGVPPSQHLSYEDAPPQQDEQQSQQPQQPGVQRRIGELTAKRKNAEELLADREAKLEESNRRLHEMSMLLARQAVVPQAPRVPTAEELEEQKLIAEMDPALKRAVQNIVRSAVGEVQAQFAPIAGAVQEMRVQQTASKYTDAVVNRARALAANWQATGKSGWNIEDAYRYAAGEAIEQGVSPLRSTQPRQANGQFTNVENLPRNGVPQQLNSSNQQQPTPAYADPSSRQYDASKARQYFANKLGDKTF